MLKRHVPSADQLSLIPLFGAMNHPDADRFNRAKDVWMREFGMYVTLSRYEPTITSTGQSWEQQAALLDALDDPEESRRLYAIDTGEPALNGRIQRFLSGAQLVRLERQENARYANNANELKAKQAADEIARQAREAKQAELLAHLELREKLLAYEGEFDSEKAALRSSLVKQASSLPNELALTPVVSQKKYWVGRHVGKRTVYESTESACPDGHWNTRYELTFVPVTN